MASNAKLSAVAFEGKQTNNNSLSQLELTKEELLWLEQHSELWVGIDPLYAPIEMLDEGEYVGMSADYLALLGQKLGINFKTFASSDWSESLEKIKKKEIDLVAAIQATSQREDFLSFSKPYIFLDTAIISRTSNLISYEQNIEDFKGKKVAVVKGYFWNDVLPIDYPEIELVVVDSLSEGLIAVSFGQVDSMFATYATVTHYIQEKGISNLRVSGLTPYKIEYAIGVRSDWPELSGILSKALDSINLEEKKKIDNKWLALEYNVLWYQRDFVVVTLLSLLALGLLVVLWNYLLHRKIKAKTLELKKANESLECLVKDRTSKLEASNKNLQESRESLQKVNKELSQLSYLDSLTQVYNRRYLDTAIQKILTDSHYHNNHLTILMVDVDFFKSYNDVYGHVYGDYSLFEVARSLERLAHRDGETFARYGGEEFTYVLPFVAEVAAEKFSKRVLQSVADLEIKHSGSEVSDYLTVSAGFVTVINDGSFDRDQLLSMADKALYEAKRRGRNQIVNCNNLIEKI